MKDLKFYAHTYAQILEIHFQISNLYIQKNKN